ncbi:MAG: hypothetical protein GWP75_13380, partial [Planctomycetia bacterium]|nr:hypothetical protein [Planctomycetia bacterium]
MSDSTNTVVMRRPPPVGSFAWAVDACGEAFVEWRSGLRPLAVFLASAAG